MIELRHLRYFCAVADELHFGRAARRLHIAQPALSRQIRRLEEEVGTTLLARTQRSVALTMPGQAFLERSRRILDEVGRAVAEANRIAGGQTGRLRVAFIHSSTYSLTPTALNIFASRHPGICVDLQEMTVIGQKRAISLGDIDIGLLRPPIEDRDLAFESVMKESFVLAVPQHHKLAGRKDVTLPELAQEQFIMFDRRQSPLFHERIMTSCEAAGFTPRVAQEAIQIHTVLGLVGAGLGIALMPDAALKLSMPRVRFLSVAQPIEPVEIALAWRRDNVNPALPLFRQAVKEGARSVRAVPEADLAPRKAADETSGSVDS